jgi:hypothetical protein
MLPSNQDQYIASVASATKAGNGDKPVILIVMSGGPVDISASRDSSDVDAIMWCGYPGQSGGTAIADALFGITNPSGKLTQTWYPESLTTQVALTDMGMRPNKSSGNPGRTYRFYTGTPVFKFGEGLSYTTFRHSNLQVDSGSIVALKASNAMVTVGVNVTNTGSRDGTEIVLVFAAPPADIVGTDGAPVQQLIAFERVFVPVGNTVHVQMVVPDSKFQYAKQSGKIVGARGGAGWQLWTGAKDSEVIRLPSIFIR